MHPRPVCAFLVVAALLVVEATHGSTVFNSNARSIPLLGGKLAADEQSGFSCGSFKPVASTAEWLRCVLHKRDWDVVLSTYLSFAICRRRHGAEATAVALAACRQKPIGRRQLIALVVNNQQLVVASRNAGEDGSPSQNANPSELMQSDQPMSAPSERSARGPQAEVIVRIEHQRASQKEDEASGEQSFSPQQSVSLFKRRIKRTGHAKPTRYFDGLAGQGVKTRPPPTRKANNHRSRNKQGRRSTTPFIIATTTTTPEPTTTEEPREHGELDWDRRRGSGRSRYVHTPPPPAHQPNEEEDVQLPDVVHNVDHIQQCNADERARCGDNADGCSKVNGVIKCQCRKHFDGDWCEIERYHEIENPPGCSHNCLNGKCRRQMPSRIDFCKCYVPYQGDLCQNVNEELLYGTANDIHSGSASESASEEKLPALAAAVDSVVDGRADLVVGNLTRATSGLPAATDRDTQTQSDAQTAARPAEGK